MMMMMMMMMMMTWRMTWPVTWPVTWHLQRSWLLRGSARSPRSAPAALNPPAILALAVMMMMMMIDEQCGAAKSLGIHRILGRCYAGSQLLGRCGGQLRCHRCDHLGSKRVPNRICIDFFQHVFCFLKKMQKIITH